MTYYFSSLQEPSENTSVYGCLINLLLQCFSIQHPPCWHMVALTPTLRRWTSKIYYHLLFFLVLAAQRWNEKWKSLMSFAFSNTWSFPCGNSYHIYNRQMSYKSGVIICRSTFDGAPLGVKLSTLSMTELEKIKWKKTIIWIQIQEVCWKPYLPHAELWFVLKKQQSMPDSAVLQCWIITDWTVYS